MDAVSRDYHVHDSYWTRLENLTAQDASDMHCLAVAVSWPHRPQDMEGLLTLGQGLVARDDIQRPIGAGMFFEYGSDKAMVGMMMTHPKLQSGGLGRQILAAIQEGLEGRQLRLNATQSAWRLYRAAGFQETSTVIQYQGLVGPVPTDLGHEHLRPATQDDLRAIQKLDKKVFGAERPEVLGRLFEKSQVNVIESGGKVTGFAMCRKFGRGHVVGPLVSESEADAALLISEFASVHVGGFLRLDADARHKDVTAFLSSIGLENYDRVVPMTRDGSYGPENAAGHVYALASQALG